MATTPVFAFRYPILGDAPNGPAAFENLATDVETQINKTRYARVAADLSKTSSTAMGDVTGLSFSLVANAEYLLDGFLSYYSLDGIDLRLAFTGPTGMTVSWGSTGLVTTSTGQAGDTDFASFEVYGDANYQVINTETDAALVSRTGGYFKTAATAGTLQMRFAQNVSNAAATIIKRGTWLRLHRFA